MWNGVDDWEIVFIDPRLLQKGDRCMQFSQLSTKKMSTSFGMLQVDLEELEIVNHRSHAGWMGTVFLLIGVTQSQLRSKFGG
jgi:hypothetical protein